jgi:hypothetical protein
MDTTLDALTPFEATEAVPAVVAMAARRLFRPGRRDTHDALERPASRLRFDSDDALTRQLIYEAGPFDLELHIAVARGGWGVSGHVIGQTDAISGEVRLIGPRASVRSALTEMLEFTLRQVPPGCYRLEVLVGDTTQVEVDSLKLGPGASFRTAEPGARRRFGRA